MHLVHVYTCKQNTYTDRIKINKSYKKIKGEKYFRKSAHVERVQSQWPDCLSGNAHLRRYLVMHTKSYDLGQERPSEPGTDQLLVSSSQRGLIQTLAHQPPCKLIHL